MSKVSKADREDFARYCAQCTDNQVRGVWEKERAANRRVYASIAAAEAEKRGIAL